MAVGTSARAETIPQISANKVIQLAPIDSAEKTPVISSVALDPAGKLLAAVGDDHLVRVFDLPSGKLVASLGVARRLGQGVGVSAGRFGAGHRRGRSADLPLGRHGRRQDAKLSEPLPA